MQEDDEAREISELKRLIDKYSEDDPQRDNPDQITIEGMISEIQMWIQNWTPRIQQMERDLAALKQIHTIFHTGNP
jgi:hypothetical protein